MSNEQETIERRTTLRVDLPGGQDRLKQMILYVARRCVSAETFGGIKLNKILWKSDFDAYAARGVPVTGRGYQRLKFGPAPKEMAPIHREMLSGGTIRIETVDSGDDVIEKRTVACFDPDLRHFDASDIGYVDAAFRHYWDKTGMEASDDSHGAAWRTCADQEPIPYESALLSDSHPAPAQMARLRQRIYDRGLLSE